MQTLSPTQEIQLSEAINLFLETLLGGGTPTPWRILWWLLARVWKDKNSFKNVFGASQKPHCNTTLFGITLKKSELRPFIKGKMKAPWTRILF